MIQVNYSTIAAQLQDIPDPRSRQAALRMAVSIDHRCRYRVGRTAKCTRYGPVGN